MVSDESYPSPPLSLRHSHSTPYFSSFPSFLGTFLMNMLLPFFVVAIAVGALLPVKAVDAVIKNKRAGKVVPVFKGMMGLPRILTPFNCMRRPMTPSDIREWSTPMSFGTRLVGVLVFTLFTLYPTLVSSIAKIVNCSVPIGGKRYLLADLTVTCYEEWHIVYLVGASVCFLLFCIGIPILVFSVVVCKNPIVCRHEKRHDAVEALERINADATAVIRGEGWWTPKKVALGADVFDTRYGHGLVIRISPDDDKCVYVEFHGDKIQSYDEDLWDSSLQHIACYSTSRRACFPPLIRCNRRPESDYSRRKVRERFGFLFHGEWAIILLSRSLSHINHITHTMLIFFYSPLVTLEGYETDGSAIVIGWEANVMLRKLLVTLAGAGISDPYLQIIGALMILIISFGLQSFFQPYEPLALDVLDSLGIFCLLCTQILSILYLYVDTSSTLVVNKAILEYGVTFCLFLMNGLALVSFLGGYVIAYLQLDWWSLRCKKREMLWLVEDAKVFERELAKQPGEIDEGGAAGGASNEEAGRVVYFWKHPTNGKVMTWPPKRMSKADDGTAQDHWVWYGENGHPESLSVEAPQLFERAPIDEKRELLPGDRTCLFDVKRMEATPLLTIPTDFGGLSLCCKVQAIRPRRGALVEEAVGDGDGGDGNVGEGIRMADLHQQADVGDPLRDDREQALPRANFDNPVQQQQAEEGISELELSARVSTHGNPMHQPQALDAAAASDLDLEEETRAADDGGIYTRTQFIEHYGGTTEWDAAETRMGEDGFTYTQAQFIEHYGGTTEWDTLEMVVDAQGHC